MKDILSMESQKDTESYGSKAFNTSETAPMESSKAKRAASSAEESKGSCIRIDEIENLDCPVIYQKDPIKPLRTSKINEPFGRTDIEYAEPQILHM